MDLVNLHNSKHLYLILQYLLLFYNYLLNIPIYKLTKEELVKLRDEHNNLKETLKLLEEKTPQELWYDDLIKLKNKVDNEKNTIHPY